MEDKTVTNLRLADGPGGDGRQPGLPRGAATLGAGTLASRVLGFVRDACIAALLGGTWTADAFLVAFRLPNLVRRLLAEGAFAYTLVPACNALRAAESGPERGLTRDEASAIFARSVILPVVAVFALVAALGVPFARPLALALAPGLAARPETLALASILLALCLPYLPLAAGAAGSASLLLARRRFRPVAGAPLVLNLTIIAGAAVAAILYGPASPRTPYILAAAVTAAGAAQWIWLAVPLAGQGIALLGPTAFGRRGSPGIDALRLRATATLRRMPGTTFAASGGQVNILAATILASFLGEGSISALYFAERLIEFPLGILGASLGLSALADLADPRLAPEPRELPEAARRRRALFAASLGGSVRLTLFLALPAAVGAACLARPVTALLFGHGAFGNAAVTATALAFAAYTPGLPALALSRPLLAATSVLGDTRAGVLAATASLFLTLVVGAAFLFFATPGALALAVSLAAWSHTAILWRALARRGGTPAVETAWLLRVLCACALMAVCVLAVQAGISSSTGCVLAGIALGAGVYGAASRLFGIKEFAVCLAAFSSRRSDGL